MQWIPTYTKSTQVAEREPMVVEFCPTGHSVDANCKHTYANHVDLCGSKFCLTDCCREHSESQITIGMEHGSDLNVIKRQSSWIINF